MKLSTSFTTNIFSQFKHDFDEYFIEQLQFTNPLFLDIIRNSLHIKQLKLIIFGSASTNLAN